MLAFGLNSAPHGRRHRTADFAQGQTEQIVKEGFATPKQVDALLKDEFRWPAGPFEILGGPKTRNWEEGKKGLIEFEDRERWSTFAIHPFNAHAISDLAVLAPDEVGHKSRPFFELNDGHRVRWF